MKNNFILYVEKCEVATETVMTKWWQTATALATDTIHHMFKIATTCVTEIIAQGGLNFEIEF